MSFKIGNVEMKGPLVLGPMAGVTDRSYRVICAEHGADLVYTEMISAKAITMKNRNTYAMIQIEESERPAALQIFGSEPDVMAEAVQIIQEKSNYDILDVNMGCPVPKVVNNHEGSSLMTDPELAGKIIEALVRVSDRPVTAKIRAGFDADHINAVEFAKRLEQAGVSAIAVHGRTREQFYAGKADWGIIKKVKDVVKVPVIGNGDVKEFTDVKKMMDETGCDAVMIARAVRGNPWFFENAKRVLNGEAVLGNGKPEIVGLCEMIRHHALKLSEEKGERTAMCEMRKHIAWYTHGYKNSAAFRDRTTKITNFKDLDEIITEIINAEID
ncbi:MAG TPA: tRNA dihydrouridine synthase DusB [Lachnospiraceae bacterium]|nr:tRNA dihydrouridine synthase DusB [Lachnospiraceae bacterium]HBR04826.1 tRNA dihydrouridine synthase DusB [Lachnospiraceae bacterium]HBZ89737.1 tRNA dihydrouridine synthase DusB [Lachnospiraceae bacterium]